MKLQERLYKLPWGQLTGIYLFPILVIFWHWFKYRNFIKENWVFYILLGALLIFTHIDFVKNKKRYKQQFIRKIYFIQTCFFIIFVSPDAKYNIWKNKEGIFNLSTEISTAIVIFAASFVLYLLIISDFYISEISVGETKISVLKEKYNEEINYHFDNINQLIAKLKAENEILANMKEYCVMLRGKIEDSGIDIANEYQLLITRYFNLHDENIKVSVLRELNNNELQEDFNLRRREIDFLRYQLESKECCSVQTKNTYYLFIPFWYIFEEYSSENQEPVYIVLESEKPIIVDAESSIIRNILIKFSDDLLSV